MKHWHETAAILERVARLPEAGRAAVATVVRISGSAYRRPGARFLVEEDGRTTGGVSGGCLETDVRGVALELMGGGAPRLLAYETGSSEETVWGMGLGCEGAVEVFVQPVGPELAALAGQARELFAAAAPFALGTVIAGERLGRCLAVGRGGLVGTTGDEKLDRGLARLGGKLLESSGTELVEMGGHRAFLEALTPPPHLFVFGAGDDARPLAALALQTGFDVTVVDHRPAYLTAERFPPPLRLALRRPLDGTTDLALGRRHFAVVQTHGLVNDREWLRALLPLPLAYLGLLGPRARKDKVLQELGVKEPPRLFAPVGLDLGADGPEQVAVSVVAEMLAVHAGREPGHLRAKPGGIHDG